MKTDRMTVKTVEALQESGKLAERLYQEQAAQGGAEAAEAGAGGGESGDEGDVVDAEFEEVKDADSK